MLLESNSHWPGRGRCREAQGGLWCVGGRQLPPLASPTRPSWVCPGTGCWRWLNRFGLRFHLCKDRVGRGLFLCVESLLVSTDGKLNYQ